MQELQVTVDQFREQGFLLVTSLIDDSRLGLLRAEADRILAESSQRGGARVSLDRSPLFATLANDDPVAELARS